VWNIGLIQIQQYYIYRQKYIQGTYPKVGLVEEMKGGGKKERKIGNNNEYITSV
jgi:hypothetical protein